ncbi:hypothetical protein D0Z03_000979 [Geotrichum reessii]|nr:hypothetical protein D0Z03_000979 [Galactomyces reessii]
MPPKKGFNKKTAQKFALVYRSTEDPLYNDDEAPKQVLVPVEDLNSRENKQERKNRYKKPIMFGEEDDQKFKESGGRDNEGEAALYGIYFDDSKYDYMQHLKPIGTTPDAVFVSKRDREKKEKNVGLLLNPEYAARNNISLPKEVLPSEHTVKRTYQDQQNIPDAIAGFQPDMDPALREVLEALDDDEYNVDEDEQDDDLFNELLKSGEMDSEDDAYYDDEYDEDYDQEYDDYSDNDSVAGAKDSSIMQRIPDMGSSISANGSSYIDSGIPDLDSGVPDIESAVPVSANGANEQDWEKDFRDLKISQSTFKYQAGIDNGHSEAEDEVGSLSAVTAVTRKNQSKKKKKKNFGGPGTEMTGLSMSSSANYRNEGLTLLDDRFDTIEEEYLDDTVEDNYETFDIKKERADLESILDDFLDNYAIDGKKLIKK